MIITTSWDDGHVLDLKLADLLDKHGLKGTFYIARTYLDERMTDAQLCDLSKRHELGAHTLNHPTLTDIDNATAYKEIAGSKLWLEDVIGKSVTSFCYPKGMYTQAHRLMALNAGYTMARTTAPYDYTVGVDPFQMPTTLHVYPFPLRPIKGIRGVRTRLQPIRKYLPYHSQVNIPITALTNWTSFATALLNTANHQNAVWHLWGHSWEIEKFDMWSSLDKILSIASQLNARSMTNTEVILSAQEKPNGR